MNRNTRLIGYNIKAEIKSKEELIIGNAIIGTWKQQFDNFETLAEWKKKNPEYEVLSTEQNEVWG